LLDTTFWKVAEEEWWRQVATSQKIIDSKEAKVARLISEIYQFIDLEVAFQGLLITAATQLSLSNSGGKYSKKFQWLLTLSMFAMVVIMTGVKFKVALVRVFQEVLNNA